MRSEPNIELSPTKDCPVIVQLNDRWRVVNDDLQWIVECQQGNKWRKLHFVATKKTVLKRIIREEGITPTSDARRAVDALPATYSEWFKARELHEVSKKIPEAVAAASGLDLAPPSAKRKDQACLAS